MTAIAIFLGFIFGTIAVVLGVQTLTRRLLGPNPSEATQELAGSVMFRIGALHGLVLALVFASEVIEYTQLGYESARETSALSDLYYDIDRYGADTAPQLRAAIALYLETVIAEEWGALGQSASLSQPAWTAWNSVYDLVLDLEPETARQRALRESMLERLHFIAEGRDQREHHAKTKIPALFWAAALVGVICIAAAYFPYPPSSANLALLTIYGGFTGLILFTIYALANPYSPPAALPPTHFTDLLAEIRAAPPG